MITAIVAFDEKLGMGWNGGLPWCKIPGDFAHFREMTINKTIAVGRKTFDTLPALKNRTVHILTKNASKHFNEMGWRDVPNNSSYKVVSFVEKNTIICGGAEIYKLFLPACEELWVTHVKGEYRADTQFPYSIQEIKKIFKYNYYIKGFDGGHNVIKYSKK